MPARSKAQQRAAGAALSAKRGETSKRALKGASREMVKSMSARQLEELASTPRKSLPTRATKASGRKTAPKKTAAPKRSTRTANR